MAVPIYVINLDARTDRWRLQAIQSRLHRLQVQRVAATDGKAGRARFPNAQMSDGATGLWSTFERLVRRLDDEGVRMAVILEDDAILKPRFLRETFRIREAMPADIAAVQLGFLGRSSWRPQRSVWKNIKRIMRLRSRLKAILFSSRSAESRPALSMGYGTHALLVFPQQLVKFLPDMLPLDDTGQPLDMEFIHASERFPQHFIRAPRSLAFQLPVRSDIPHKKALKQLN